MLCTVAATAMTGNQHSSVNEARQLKSLALDKLPMVIKMFLAVVIVLIIIMKTFAHSLVLSYSAQVSSLHVPVIQTEQTPSFSASKLCSVETG